MPKIVNHEERKASIAKATWKVIARDGLKGATVRSIA
ncbi:DNA-binding transcriptional regulator YbjK [Lysinibacillus parviboronicapiens]|uniref:DNA-binding transcriptional regulator YbjK n=1 Tax=Lysinibacillus parviboronicapiens TaxID=436516 RepID=A0ABV2PPF9_9BACI